MKIPIDTNNIVNKAISLFGCLIETKYHEQNLSITASNAWFKKLESQG